MSARRDERRGRPVGCETVDERVRLFVALELPPAVVRTLVRWRDGVVTAESGLRAVSPASLHVTLCFLGWRSASEIDPIARACETVADRAAPELRIGDPAWLPPRRPRVLAVRLSELTGALAGIQSRLSECLARGGWYAAEARPFLPHVTVARAIRGARVRERELPDVPGERFTATRVTLYRSRLVRGGAQYEPMTTVRLSGRS